MEELTDIEKEILAIFKDIQERDFRHYGKWDGFYAFYNTVECEILLLQLSNPQNYIREMEAPYLLTHIKKSLDVPFQKKKRYT
ncbi:MAG: hypothetical protein ACMUEM_04825 [Flavobacteriales bacterium AspAUS03]